MEQWMQRCQIISSSDGDYYERVSPSPNTVSKTSVTTNKHPQRQTTLHEGILGLVNVDSNSCAVNALLQCFIATIPLANEVLSSSLPCLKTPLFSELVTIISTAWNPELLPETFTEASLSQNLPAFTQTDSSVTETIPVAVYNPQGFVRLLNSLFPTTDDQGYRDVASLFTNLMHYKVCFHGILISFFTF